MRCSIMENPPNKSPLSGAIPPAPGRDGWAALSTFTNARIALGRAGGSWRTETLLNFRMAHAQAGDAVNKSFAVEAMETQLNEAGFKTVQLTSQADSKAVYLKHPDLGRKLSEPSRLTLMQNLADWSGKNLGVIISDGLSALAAEKQAVPLLKSLLPVLHQAGWTICPLFIIPQARVKLQDELGTLLGLRQTLMLLGERPGLGSADSLGAYFTYHPQIDRTDADRNCLSNIRPDGLPPVEAGLKIAELLMQSVLQQKSGIGLKPEPEKYSRSLE